MPTDAVLLRRENGQRSSHAQCGVRLAVSRQIEHLAPGGIAIVQPYLTPDELQVGTAEYTVESGDLRVKRTRHSERNGQRQRVHFHFTVEGPDGTQELDENHEFELFTIDEMLAAFLAVGLVATFDPGSPDAPGGRGFYVATASA